jgi:hypothetical protein
MLPGDMIQYLHQIRRVIRKNGKCYLTLFLLNEESRPSMASHDGLDFRNDHGYYRTLNDNVREANVAYDENYLFEKILPETKFKVGLLKYGFWSGRPKEESLDFQDTLILYPID